VFTAYERADLFFPDSVVTLQNLCAGPASHLIERNSDDVIAMRTAAAVEIPTVGSELQSYIIRFYFETACKASSP
jgi:hypothetical protein